MKAARITIAAAAIVLGVIIVARGASYLIERADSAASACEVAATTCPLIEGNRIAEIRINNPDGSTTCSYYRPYGQHITRATVFPVGQQ